MSTFSEHLRQARQAARHTQESIAEAMGMERTNYVPYETGKKLPAPKIIFKMAKALGLPPETVFLWMTEDVSE